MRWQALTDVRVALKRHAEQTTRLCIVGKCARTRASLAMKRLSLLANVGDEELYRLQRSSKRTRDECTW